MTPGTSSAFAVLLTACAPAIAQGSIVVGESGNLYQVDQTYTFSIRATEVVGSSLVVRTFVEGIDVSGDVTATFANEDITDPDGDGEWERYGADLVLTFGSVEFDEGDRIKVRISAVDGRGTTVSDHESISADARARLLGSYLVDPATRSTAFARLELWEVSDLRTYGLTVLRNGVDVTNQASILDAQVTAPSGSPGKGTRREVREVEVDLASVGAALGDELTLRLTGFDPVLGVPFYSETTWCVTTTTTTAAIDEKIETFITSLGLTRTETGLHLPREACHLPKEEGGDPEDPSNEIDKAVVREALEQLQETIENECDDPAEFRASGTSDEGMISYLIVVGRSGTNARATGRDAVISAEESKDVDLVVAIGGDARSGSNSDGGEASAAGGTVSVAMGGEGSGNGSGGNATASGSEAAAFGGSGSGAEGDGGDAKIETSSDGVSQGGDGGPFDTSGGGGDGGDAVCVIPRDDILKIGGQELVVGGGSGGKGDNGTGGCLNKRGAEISVERGTQVQ